MGTADPVLNLNGVVWQAMESNSRILRRKMKCFKVRLWWFSAWFWHSCSPTALNYFWRGNEVQRKEPWFMNSDSNKIHVGGWSARIISWFFILRLLGYDWPEHTKEGQRCKTTAFPSCWWVLLRSRAVPEGHLLLAGNLSVGFVPQSLLYPSARWGHRARYNVPPQPKCFICHSSWV